MLAFSFAPPPDWGRQLWSDHSDTLDLFIKQGADGEIIFIKFCCEKCSCKNLTWPLDPDDAADEADFGAHPVFIRPNNTANTILDFQGRDTRIQLPLSARC